jgi:putative transcriptional regulator
MDLTGKFLIAMPGMADPRFDKSVVFLCSHSPEGTMGLIVNKPGVDMTFSGLLDQIGLNMAPGAAQPKVQFGGPVEMARGFVLHSDDWTSEAGTMSVPGGLAMSATLDILQGLAKGIGPSKALLLLGYAGWGPGQLESEILRNDWLTSDARVDLIFDTPNSGKWAQALGLLGIDPITLSATAGRA